MPNETKTAATTTAKASKIHGPMLTLQRAVAYIVLLSHEYRWKNIGRKW